MCGFCIALLYFALLISFRFSFAFLCCGLLGLSLFFITFCLLKYILYNLNWAQGFLELTLECILSLPLYLYFQVFYLLKIDRNDDLRNKTLNDAEILQIDKFRTWLTQTVLFVKINIFCANAFSFSWCRFFICPAVRMS